EHHRPVGQRRHRRRPRHRARPGSRHIEAARLPSRPDRRHRRGDRGSAGMRHGARLPRRRARHRAGQGLRAGDAPQPRSGRGPRAAGQRPGAGAHRRRAPLGGRRLRRRGGGLGPHRHRPPARRLGHPVRAHRRLRARLFAHAARPRGPRAAALARRARPGVHPRDARLRPGGERRLRGGGGGRPRGAGARPAGRLGGARRRPRHGNDGPRRGRRFLLARHCLGLGAGQHVRFPQLVASRPVPPRPRQPAGSAPAVRRGHLRRQLRPSAGTGGRLGAAVAAARAGAPGRRPLAPARGRLAGADRGRLLRLQRPARDDGVRRHRRRGGATRTGRQRRAGGGARLRHQRHDGAGGRPAGLPRLRRLRPGRLRRSGRATPADPGQGQPLRRQPRAARRLLLDLDGSGTAPGRQAAGGGHGGRALGGQARQPAQPRLGAPRRG
ncbi:MAG: FIG140336: TPR domain protein, partial [uncultured Acetobacteraceae bacterium]